MMRSVFFTLIFQTIHFLREVKVNTAPWEAAYGLKAWIGMNFVYLSPTSLDVTAPTYVPVSNDAFSTRAQNRDTNGRKFWTATSAMFCSCWKVKKQQCMIKWNKVLSLVKKWRMMFFVLSGAWNKEKIFSSSWEIRIFSLSHARDKTKNIFLRCRISLVVLSLVEKLFI